MDENNNASTKIVFSDELINDEIEQNGIRKCYDKTKKQKIDICNICGKTSQLTWDHVPPKFCFNAGFVKYNSMMGKVDLSNKYSISQNGVKFRTICENCNNNLLGAKYDKEYKKLVDCLYNLYISKGKIPQYIIIKGLKINKIARAVVGHFLAAREDFCDSDIERELRKYFLDEMALPPKDLNLLYYTYRYNTMMIIRDIVPKHFGNLEYDVPNAFQSCLNTFPIAFILANECENKCGLYDMFEICTSNIEEKIDIKIDLLSYLYPNHKHERDPYWPCNVNDSETGTSIILTSETGQRNSVLSDIRELKK